MGRNAPALILIIAGLAGCAAFAVWAFKAGDALGGGWESLAPIWPYVIGGVVVAALAGGLMWLAFFSARRGYDDRIDSDDF